jgi:FtsP/CotA-like multicopper oxidase with cupredoxin domain
MTQYRFSRSRIAVAALVALSAPFANEWAYAGAGWGDSTSQTGAPIKVPTYYANSPSGLRASTACFDALGKPATPLAGATCDSGAALQKFVDSLPLLPSASAALKAANASGITGSTSLSMAVKESATSYTGSDYYEIAVVEYRQQMHSNLPIAGTALRGYVQIWTPKLPATAPKVALNYLDGKPVLDLNGQQVYTVGAPRYLGPIIEATQGTAVRLKFTNYLPVGRFDPITKTRGGDIFLPTDTTVAGSGLGPDGQTQYPQNRANIHLHGGDTPWISDGMPHAWITPAKESNRYNRGVATRNVPDMADPGPGSQTFYFPNNQSARMEWFHDHSVGATRINVYAGIVSAYLLRDATERALITAGTLPADEIPLIYEDKTFVPKDIASQDAKWNQDAWGKYGDLWMPHVYETNQDPNSYDGTNPVGRWDYGPWFWPIFPAPLALPSGDYGDASGVQESFGDTSIVNGVAYPNLSVDPKTYRFRILNASTSRFVNFGLYVAEPLTITVADGGAGYVAATPPAVAVLVGGVPSTRFKATAVVDSADGTVAKVLITDTTPSLASGLTVPPHSDDRRSPGVTWQSHCQTGRGH